MIKVKDGYAKLINTLYTGDISLVLLSNGSTIGYDVSTNTILATIGSNVASADKLKNKVKLWGLDFDGTSDVNGSIVMNNNSAFITKDTGGTNRTLIHLNNNNSFSIGYGSSTAGYDTYIDGNNIYLRYGTSHTTGLLLNSSGNVTIGSSDLASTNYKLYVDGSTYLGNNVVIPNNRMIHWKDTNGTVVNSLFVSDSNNFHIGYGVARAGYNTYLDGNKITFRYGTTPNDGMVLSSSGNVGIGTTSPAYKLDVNGVIRATSHLITNARVKILDGLALEWNDTVANGSTSNLLLPRKNLNYRLEYYDGTNWYLLAYKNDIPTKISQLTNDSGYVTGGPYLPLSGGTMNGVITMPINNQIQWGSNATMIYGNNSVLYLFAKNILFNNNNLWHSGNDGAGSGLDADMLDGQHGSYYAAASSLNNYLPLTGGTMKGKIYFSADASDTIWVGATAETSGSKSYLDFHISDDASDAFRWTTTLCKEGGNVSFTMMQLSGSNTGAATLALTGNMNATGTVTATKFTGTLTNTLTFSAGAFTAKTYNNSAAITVNIPTHTSHLTNNSGFLTAHLSLANYVTLNSAQTISGVKTFSTQLKFTVAAGTAPFTVTSTTKVTNLNADRLDDLHSTDFVIISRINNSTNVDTLTSNNLYYTLTDGDSATLTNAPFSRSFIMLQFLNYSSGDDIRRSRIAISADGSARLFNDRSTSGTGGAWYDILTNNNSSVSGGGSTWGSSITVTINGTSKTLTIPSNPNVDTKVTLTITTTNANYRVLFSANANDTTETTTARKAANLLFNPSTGTLSTTTFSGTATKVTCTATDTNKDRPIVGTNTSNQLYYTTKATVNWSTGIIKAVGFLGNLIGGATGSIVYQSAADTTAFLAAPTTNGYVLKYNTSTNAPYWAADSNSNTWRAIQANGTQIAATGTGTYALNFVSGTGITVAGTAGSSSAANKITITNAGVRSTTINGNYLRVNTNGTNSDLTIPYATKAGDADMVDGLHSSSLFRQLGTNPDINTYADSSNKNGIIYINTTTPTDINAPFSYGSILSMNTSAASWMVACSSGGILSYRYRWWSGNGNSWSSWYNILTSSNSSVSGGGSSWGSSITVKINNTTATLTIPSNPNTHWTTRIYAGASGTAANAAATNPYLKVTDNNTYRNQVRFIGSGATTVSSDASGNITISSTDNNTDTKNTAGSTNSTSKLFLIGATSLAANPVTYSNSGVYTLSGSVYATHFYETSDSKYKTNIQSIIGINNIPQLREFAWKKDGSKGYGFIAQELEELGYYELVDTDELGDKTVNYSAALSLTVAKLQNKISELEKEIEILKNKN